MERTNRVNKTNKTNKSKQLNQPKKLNIITNKKRRNKMEPKYVENLSEPWFTLIKIGNKKCEGRLNKRDFSQMKKGECIIFENNDFLRKIYCTSRYGDARYIRNINKNVVQIYGKSEFVRMSDNPDDRQIKLFVYNSEKEIWTKEDAQFTRKIDTNSGDILGVVRALTAKSFKQSFYLSGQYSSIKYNSNS